MRQLALLTCFIATATAHGAAADGIPLLHIIACAHITEPAQRQKCHENEARKRAAEAERRASGGAAANWRVRESVDPLTDKPTVLVYTVAQSTASRRSDQPMLYLRCRRDRTDAWISWGTYVGADRHRVSWRFGSHPHQSGFWSASVDGTGSFVPNPIQFIRTLMGEPRFVAQASARLVVTDTVVFDTSGLAEAIKPLQEACGWR